MNRPHPASAHAGYGRLYRLAAGLLSGLLVCLMLTGCGYVWRGQEGSLSENSVLGTLIADAEVNASLVFTRVRPEDFVTGISRQIFETCRAMYGRGDVIDPLTVKAACGSEFATWLKELEQITPSARYCGAYVDKLLELSRRYRLQKLFREALDGNFAGLPMEELIGKIECMNNVVADDNDQRSSTMTDLLTDFYGRMGTERQYLDWGFDELNRYVKVNPKHYVVVGARPSAGKTAFALQVALQDRKSVV